MIVGGFFYPLAVIAVTLRLMARKIWGVGLKGDDLCILVAAVCL